MRLQARDSYVVIVKKGEVRTITAQKLRASSLIALIESEIKKTIFKPFY